MTYIPVVHGIKAVLRQALMGEEVQNTLHFVGAAPVDVTMLSAVTSALNQWWGDMISPLVSTELALIDVHAIKLDAQNDPEFVTSSTYFGQLAEQLLPGNAALCVTFRTSLRGKSFRGRFYLSGLTTAALVSLANSNQADPTYLASVLDAFAALNTYVPGAISGSPSQVVVSRFTNKFPRVTGLATQVIGFDANPYLDSQRRRLHGRGI